MSGDFYADDPHPAWTWMRRNEPVYHDEANGIWGVTRYRDVRALQHRPGDVLQRRGHPAEVLRRCR